MPAALPTLLVLPLVAGTLALVQWFAKDAAPVVTVATGVLLAHIAQSHSPRAAAAAALPALAALLAADSFSALTTAALAVLLVAAGVGAWRYAQRPADQCPVLALPSFENLALAPVAALLFSATSLLAPHAAVSAAGLYVIAVLGSAALQRRRQPWSRLSKAFATGMLLLAGVLAGARPGSEQLMSALAVLMIGASAFALLIRNDLALYTSVFAMVFVASGTETTAGTLAAVTGACISLAHARLSYVRNLTADLRRRLGRLRTQAERDELTGALNRRGFYATASAALSLAHRTQRPCTLFYFDLDGFKSLNDRFGHARGDAFLKAVAHHLSRNLRSSDVFGRLGGDEFAILGIDVGEAGEAAVRQKIAAACAAASTDVSVGASIGCIRLQGADRCDLDALLAEADASMYNDKRTRKSGAVPTTVTHGAA